MKNYDSTMENIIDFWKGEPTASVQLSTVIYKKKLRRYAELYPDECKIIADNADGTMLFRIPVKWIVIRRPKTMSEKQLSNLHGNT